MLLLNIVAILLYLPVIVWWQCSLNVSVSSISMPDDWGSGDNWHPIANKLTHTHTHAEHPDIYNCLLCPDTMCSCQCLDMWKLTDISFVMSSVCSFCDLSWILHIRCKNQLILVWAFFSYFMLRKPNNSQYIYKVYIKCCFQKNKDSSIVKHEIIRVYFLRDNLMLKMYCNIATIEIWIATKCKHLRMKHAGQHYLFIGGKFWSPKLDADWIVFLHCNCL